MWFRNLNPRTTRYGLETLTPWTTKYDLETLILGKPDMV